MNDALKALQNEEKIRMKSWWWGRYILKQGDKIRDSEGGFYPTKQLPNKNNSNLWEVYNEEKHGKHNRDPIDAKYEDAYLRDIGRLK